MKKIIPAILLIITVTACGPNNDSHPPITDSGIKSAAPATDTGVKPTTDSSHMKDTTKK